MFDFKSLYYGEVTHVIEDYGVKFNKYFKNIKDLEDFYKIDNLKINLKITPNTTKDKYIKIMSSNPFLRVSHTMNELLEMDLNDIMNLYDVNDYHKDYKTVKEEDYNKFYKIVANIDIYKKKFGRYRYKGSKKETKIYDNASELMEDIIKLNEIDAEYTVSVNEFDVSLYEYLAIIKLISNSELNLENIITSKEDLITYLRDLKVINKLVEKNALY